MVAIEYIPESRGLSIHPYSLTDGPSLPQSALEVVRRDVSKALDLLHDLGLVFGDLLPEDGSVCCLLILMVSDGMG